MNTATRLQAQVYSLQCLTMAMLVRQLEQSESIDDAGRDVLDTAIGSIAKFDLRGDNTPEQRDEVRATMEAFATDCVTAAMYSARSRAGR